MTPFEVLIPVYLLVSGLIYGLRTESTRFIPDDESICLFIAGLWPIWMVAVFSVEYQRHGGVMDTITDIVFSGN